MKEMVKTCYKVKKQILDELSDIDIDINTEISIQDIKDH